ncbi:MAG: DUF58 domain-containing protein [Eubacteriales bacterium]|nr:DUF58 domain-containing protein [Eubacteriales bacterium]
MEVFFRKILYLIFLLINGSMFYFLHSHFYFMFLLIMLVAPFVSLASAAWLKRKISCEIQYLGDAMARQNEEMYFCIRIHNPTFFVSLDTKLLLTFENTFMETCGTKVISVPVRARKGYTLSVPMVPQMAGIVRVTVTELRIKDLMGLHFFKRKVEASKDAPVLPYRRGGFYYDASGVMQGMIESEESTKRGSDFSDVQEIREYIPGDKLNNIHWKLSAKRDILMVKDRVSMSDRQLVVVPELWGQDKRMLDLILASTYTIVKTFIEDKTTVRLVYWSAKRYEYEDIRIDYGEDIDQSFVRMFYEHPYPNAGEAAEHMASVYPQVHAYLHVAPGSSDVAIQIRENV